MNCASGLRTAGRLLFGLVLIAIGLLLACGGVRLIWLGGSLYYLPAGLVAGSAAMLGLAVWGTSGFAPVPARQYPPPARNRRG